MIHTFKHQMDSVTGVAGKFIESIWHSRVMYTIMKNAWKSYRREKSKMLQNWIKQQISRKSIIENNFKNCLHHSK